MVADLRAEAVAAARRAPAELQAAAHALGEDAGADDRYAAALAGAERLDAWGADRCLNAALEEFGAAYAPATALRELSVGRRYRLRLACALAEPAGTILLDEPSRHLDDATLDRLAERLLAHEGITVFVTRNPVPRYLRRVPPGAIREAQRLAGTPRGEPGGRRRAGAAHGGGAHAHGRQPAAGSRAGARRSTAAPAGRTRPSGCCNAGWTTS
jgi:hypothetical protein